MKLIIVRIKENKEPVMVVGGHIESWGIHDLNWKIDECTSPMNCELADIEINDRLMGFMWSGQLDKSDEGDYMIFDDISLTGDYGALLGDFFADDSLDWVTL